MAMIKAIILDANCFSGNNLRDEIKNAISRGNLVPIWSKSGQLADELKKGPVVLVFYRGEWGPFCNLILQTAIKFSQGINHFFPTIYTNLFVQLILLKK